MIWCVRRTKEGATATSTMKRWTPPGVYDVARLMFFSARPVAGVLLWWCLGLRLQLCTYPERARMTCRHAFLLYLVRVNGAYDVPIAARAPYTYRRIFSD